MPKTLHIVNGDAFGDKLRASGIDGDILVWRESLYEGPIGMDMSDRVLLSMRASYLYERYGIPKELFVSTTLQQEKSLDALGGLEEVVLWFEHDLYDQWMLCYLLSRLAALPPRSFCLSLLCIDHFPGVEPFYGLGQLSIEQICSLHGAWAPVAESQLRLGRQAWKAYSAAEPLLLSDLLADDLTALPYLRKALEVQLSRFPSMQNGLSALERLTLGLIKEANIPLPSLFGQVSSQASEYGLGDLQFWGLLNGLWQCEMPLVHISGGEHLPMYGEAWPLNFENYYAGITELGHEVLEGRKDNVLLNGIDDWIGGVRLLGREGIWRQNPADYRLERQ